MNAGDDDSSSCPVCKEHFTDGLKIPVCLKCGHVLCRECAFTIMRTSDTFCRVCPICRTPSTFSDIRVIYMGNVQLVAERTTLESENVQLRERLCSTKKKFEENLRTLRWLESEYNEKCNQRSKMLSFYQKSSGYLYRRMRYYRNNWYRLKHNFDKLKLHKNRLDSELSLLKSRFKVINSNCNRNGRLNNYRRRQSAYSGRQSTAMQT